MDTGTWQPDALENVKMDPAVLDAQITLDSFTRKQFEDKCNEVPAQDDDDDTNVSETPTFEDLMKKQKAALFSLAPLQFELLLKYAGILRMQRSLVQKQLECGFCKKNGEPSWWYSSHVLKDSRGRVKCPVLRGYRCPFCGDTGDFAHTIKYCPMTADGDRVGRGR